MNAKAIKGISVPDITLGTVQLGIPYGLKDDAKAPTTSETMNVLECAFQHGITCFDTAAAYGDAECKLGAWHGGHKATICTKIHDLDTSSSAALLSSMRKHVMESKNRLQLTCIPILMIHHFDEYIVHKQAFDEAFSVLKQEGHIRLSGVSAYSTDDYHQIAASGLDTAQVPMNILDWTQIESGGLRSLADAGMIVFARSIYLQGLLLRNADTLPVRMMFAKDTLERFIALCEKYGMTQKELAMSFVLSLQEISSLVIGCRDENQIIGNCDVYSRCRRLTQSQLEEIHDSFRDTDKKILIPMLWPKD